MRKASLEEIREMLEAGKLHHNPDAPTDVEELGAHFWKEAQVLRPKAKPQSVHLKLDPDVFEFFKGQGKGHLTRMQNVLKAFARAHLSK